jgi:hypothetical protein
MLYDWIMKHDNADQWSIKFERSMIDKRSMTDKWSMKHGRPIKHDKWTSDI